MITQIIVTKIFGGEGYTGDVFVNGEFFGSVTGPTWQGAMDRCAEIASRWERDYS